MTNECPRLCTLEDMLAILSSCQGRVRVLEIRAREVLKCTGLSRLITPMFAELTALHADLGRVQGAVEELHQTEMQPGV